MPQIVPARATVLDDVLPGAALRMTHARAVRASVEATAAAIRETPVHEARVAFALLLVRSAGGVRQAGDVTLAGIAGLGDAAVVDLGGRGSELAVGWTGQPWPGAPGIEEPLPTSLAEFAADRDPDVVRVGLSIRCAAAAYGTLLVTETRIVPGAYAARPFARYWSVVRLGSGLVRTSLLRAIARRAEAADGS